MAEEEKKEARYRLLTLRVAVGLTMAAGADANVKRIIRPAGKMKFAARLDRAQHAGLISDEHTADIDLVNHLRNRLLHFDIQRGIADVREIASPEAFGEFTKRGMRAWEGFSPFLMPLFQAAAEPDQPTTE